MSAVVSELWRSRLKGAQGVNQNLLFVDPTHGVAEDRRCAIRRKTGRDLTRWMPKGVYYVCMNTPQMAVEVPTFGSDGRLTADYVSGLKGRITEGDDFELQYADDTYSLHDTKGAYVSFLNLASVRALAGYMGRYIDPARFRMNVWMSGLEPFEELTWVDAYPGTRELRMNNAHFRVDDACERCRAPEANPLTGQFDLEIRAALDAMMSARGYKSPHREVPCVMGILAAPLGFGSISVTEQISLV